MTITAIARQRPSSQRISEPLVDIVAVHGIFENDEQTWVEPISGISWLRDLLPEKLPHCRILRYSYPIDAFTLPGVDSSKSILTHAQNLVAELYADRDLENAASRPILFVCHGFGGLLVKRALSLSHSRVNSSVNHLRSIFTCTYGLLFFSTPHAGINEEAVFFRGSTYSCPNQFVLSLATGSQMLDEISDQFAPLMGKFSIFNFWESVQTQRDGRHFYVVDQESAAPANYDVEKCGLPATHSGMVKFDSLSDRKFLVVLEALWRYCRLAPPVIEMRRQQEAESVKYRRQQAADELYQCRSQHVLDVDAESFSYNQWSFVPRRSSTFFTGRQRHAQELKNMLGTIRRYNGHGTPTVVVIYGLGGSGKTQFCLKYAEDNKAKYWGVFWVDASSEQSLEADFAIIGAQSGKGPSMASAMYWLSQCKEPWLLIVDNADDPDVDVSSYFPNEGNGHVLITTRNPNAVEYSTSGNHLHFRGMEPHDAINLLLKAAYPHPNHSLEPTTPGRWHLAEGIAIELGYLPLAIAQAGATIRRNIYTLERYLKYYLLQRRNMLSHSRVKSVDEVNIITTWEIPFQRIVGRKSLEHKDAVDLMHIFAFMHYESIPEHIFQRSWHVFREPEFPLKHCPDILQPVWNEEAQARFRRAIRVLYDHSIVDYEPNKGSCIMHPVVHNWARDRLEEDDQKKWLRFTMAILAHCISTELGTSRRSFRALLLPHISSCLKLHDSQPKGTRDTIHSAAEMELFAKVYAENGLWRSACKLQDKVINIRNSLLGRGHKDTISVKINKGQSLWNLFEVKDAIEVQIEVLNTLRWRRPSFAEWTVWPVWEPIHVPYCIALGEITQTLWLAGQRGWSEHCGRRAVDGLTRRLGNADPLTLKAMFHLARTYFHVGRDEDSRNLLVWVLKLQKRFFGMDHPDTLMTRNELGMLLCAQKKHLKAAQILVENVLNSRRRILGEEHAYTLWSVNDLSKIYVELGRPHDAADMLESIIPIVKRTLGPTHVGMTLTMSNLGKAYFMSERWEKAEETVRPLLDTIQKDHPDSIHNKYGYAQILYNLGRLHEAETYCKEILEQVTRSSILSLSDSRTVATADLLDKIYHHQGKQQNIEELVKRIPGIGLVKNEDRFDPYAVRRASSQQPPNPNLGPQQQTTESSSQSTGSTMKLQESRRWDQSPRRLITSRTF